MVELVSTRLRQAATALRAARGAERCGDTKTALRLLVIVEGHAALARRAISVRQVGLEVREGLTGSTGCCLDDNDVLTREDGFGDRPEEVAA